MSFQSVLKKVKENDGYNLIYTHDLECWFKIFWDGGRKELENENKELANGLKRNNIQINHGIDKGKVVGG